MTIADTDVLIDFLAGVDPAAEKVASELERGSLQTTSITRFELLSAASHTKQEAQVGQLLSAIPALPLDGAATDQAAGVRASLESSGSSIGMADSLIAGIALAHDAPLLTRNMRQFENVAGLRLVTLGE